jgi:hypothetical protein
VASAKPSPKGPPPKLLEEGSVHWVAVALICAALLVAFFGVAMYVASAHEAEQPMRKAVPCE